MAKRIEVQYQGKTVPAEELEFRSTSEPWTEYQLEDGTVIKIKAILASVHRLVDRYKEDGEPVYGLVIGNLPVLSIPPALKQVPTQSPNAEKR